MFRGVLSTSGLERDRAIDIAADGTIAAIRAGRGPYDGFLAIPGMPNAHSHSFQHALGGFGEAIGGEDSFWGWREAMYRLAGSVAPDRLFAVARRCYAKMLCAGFTHVAEFHYLHHLHGDGRSGSTGAGLASESADAIVAAAGDIGLPLSLLPVYYRTSGFGGADALPAQRRFVHDSVDSFLETLQALGDKVAGAAAHSLRAAPPSEIAEVVAGVDEALGPDAPLHIHISEQEREVERCRAVLGRTPIDLLADTVELGPRWSLVHATHATSAERVRLRRSGAKVVLTPLTEAYLGDGVFPVREHMREGGAAAIGSDANVRISPIEEVRQLEYGQRLRDRRRARLAADIGTAPDAWAWLAAGGGGATGGWPGNPVPTGRIEPGCRADLVVLDANGPHLLGHSLESAMDAWLVGGDDRDIEAVYVGGQRMAERGVLAGRPGKAATSEIDASYMEAMRAIWSS